MGSGSRRWDRRLAAPRVAVNVSPVQLRGSTLVADVGAALARHPGESGLELEVTESALMGNVADAIASLRRIRELGVEIALDDFGTGYSSLSYLFQLPISTMKIDSNFIDGVTDQADKLTADEHRRDEQAITAALRSRRSKRKHQDHQAASADFSHFSSLPNMRVNRLVRNSSRWLAAFSTGA